jgi:putative PIN family toxin of toxin-antitoxin system
LAGIPPRRQRTPIVADTNVFIRSFKARSPQNPNRRVIRLWLLERRLQLIVSQELIAEYLEIFAEVLGMDATLIAAWRLRFENDPRSTLVGLGRRYTESRDPDDNVLLATARAGNARYLLTNDRDLLELPAEFQRTLPFAIRTPWEFLQDEER